MARIRIRSGTHIHRHRSGTPQPLEGTKVLHCHNKSLNKQQQHGKPQHQQSNRARKECAEGNSTSVVNTKAEHDADAVADADTDADADVDAGVAVLLLHSAYRAEFPV